MLRPRVRPKPTARDAAGIPKAAASQQRPTELTPLSELEWDEFAVLLEHTHLGLGMRVEEVDGFFAALLCGPRVAKPCEYWPVVLGKDVGDPTALAYIRTTTSLLPFFARHWDSISQTLQRDGLHVPYLTANSEGVVLARDWARGFMRAVELRAEHWQPLINNELYVAALLPMMILAHEDDHDPMLRPPPIASGQRESLIRHMTVGLIRARGFFAQLHPSVGIPRPANLH